MGYVVFVISWAKDMIFYCVHLPHSSSCGMKCTNGGGLRWLKKETEFNKCCVSKILMTRFRKKKKKKEDLNDKETG